MVPKTPQLGVVLGGEVRIRPVATIPVVISAGWDRKLVRMDGCIISDEVPVAVAQSIYAPFCGWAPFDELRLGFGIVF